MGDLKSELSLVGGPSADISLATMAGYTMADGFWDTYGFQSFQTPVGAGPVPLTYFYDLQTDASYDFYPQSSITDYQDFGSILTNGSKAGATGGGPNDQPINYFNPTSGVIQPGTNQGINIVHMNQLEVQVSCSHIVPPIPPFTDLFIEWDNQGAGFAPFPGSPFNGPSIGVNSGIQYNSPNNAGTPLFTVICYQ